MSCSTCILLNQQFQDRGGRSKVILSGQDSVPRRRGIFDHRDGSERSITTRQLRIGVLAFSPTGGTCGNRLCVGRACLHRRAARQTDQQAKRSSAHQTLVFHGTTLSERKLEKRQRERQHDRQKIQDDSPLRRVGESISCLLDSGQCQIDRAGVTQACAGAARIGCVNEPMPEQRDCSGTEFSPPSRREFCVQPKANYCVC